MKDSLYKPKYVCSKRQALNFMNEFKGICKKYGLTFSCDDPYCFPFVLTKLETPLVELMDMTIADIDSVDDDEFFFFDQLHGMLVFDKFFLRNG